MARIVAELGRPETPDETADRKAETSRQHRANQTVRNLVWSLVATLAVVLVLVLVVVRPEPAPVGAIDYKTVAEQAQGSVSERLAIPDLPAGWTANAAEIRTSGGVQSWYIGFITPSGDFIAFTQGIEANPSWTDDVLDGHAPTGATTIVIDWVTYDYRKAKDPGNLAYSLVGGPRDGSTFVLSGTADDKEFATLATAVANSIGVEGKTNG